ncbi:hypothetical protein PVAP13_6NG114909 [Panicum virgatum]|uniref:Uncharacterized protein n=1 Tax=Panicum virgatum TaxID=38727 RepID=A0A8T0R0C7_PANVG|nr:hypothetical protein PVAP13_6NG114909 [Panicum virgatum]
MHEQAARQGETSCFKQARPNQPSLAVRAFYPLAGRLRLTPGTPATSSIPPRPPAMASPAHRRRRPRHRRPAGGRQDRPARVCASGGRRRARASGHAPPARAPQPRHRRRRAHHAAVDGSASKHFLPTRAHHLFTIFALSRDDVRRVNKDTVAAHRRVAPPRCTLLVATLGLVWSCYQRAKVAAATSTPTAASTGGDRTCLLFPADHRSPASTSATASAPRSPWLQMTRSRLAARAACSARAPRSPQAGIDEAVGGIWTGSMGASMGRVSEVAGAMSMLSVAGSPRFRVYELDLGVQAQQAGEGGHRDGEDRRCGGG